MQQLCAIGLLAVIMITMHSIEDHLLDGKPMPIPALIALIVVIIWLGIKIKHLVLRLRSKPPV